MNSERWQRLRAAGARPQRPLWASTGVKNPEYSDTMYVDQLVAPGTVNTMPEKTLDATADHANITGDTVRPFYEQAWNTMAALKDAGVDYDDVVKVLEDEGVEKFEASWNELLESVTKNLVP
jgi:transaldolase